ncbi:MAG: peroxiredoxin [Actinomycetota bacterium]|nr:peroxiredoxin [Actinomycetota bacterium]
MTGYQQLPENLPAPVDDGSADRLTGSMAPPVELVGSDGGQIRLDQLSGRTVLFCYPRTGTPGQPIPTGWDSIPGARGCTPQACAIRDAYAEFKALGAAVFGLSTQAPADQVEAAHRLNLPYPLLSDLDLALTHAWQLPTFSVDGLTLIRRITIFLTDGLVDGLIYPVFPPDRSAEDALAWLRTRATPLLPGRHRPVPPRRGRPHPIPPRIVR